MDFSNISSSNYGQFIEYLKEFADEKYKKFNSGLVPNLKCEMIGIRVPILRKIAKEIIKGDCNGFLQSSGREYYEEIMLRGIVTAQLKGSFEELAVRADDFICYIDNWAVCDTFCSTFKNVRKYPSEFFEHIKGYLNSVNPWSMRVALVMMMMYYLDDEYIDRVLECSVNVKSEEYYVQMANAWLIATAYAKFRDKAHSLIASGKLDNTTLNMTVQKCCDSYRISKEDKALLKAMRRR